MKTRKLENLEVSPIGMGCMGFSHGYGKIPHEDYSIEAIQKAYEFGCTFFDTAEAYAPNLDPKLKGHNEKILGEAIKYFRKNIVIATKMKFDDSDVGKNLYEILKSHLTASLKNLQTDFVDLYYLHRINNNFSLAEIASAFGKLIDEGIIRAWGLSQISVEQLDEANKITPVSAVQNLYNILERDCEEKIFPYCLENNIGVVPFSPIASGLLSGKITVDTKFDANDDVRNFVPQLSKENIISNQPIVDAIQNLAEKKNATPAQISLAWMLKKYPNVVPIPGSKNQGRILENFGAWNIELSDEEFSDFEKILSSLKIYGHRGSIENSKSTFKDWKR